MALRAATAAAYSATGRAWQTGPGRIYDVLAAEVVRRCPGGVHGRRVLDLGAGTGAATRAARRAGAADVVAADAALGMLAAWPGRPASVVGDAAALPLGAAVFDAVVAAFSVNHLDDPIVGLREAARVLRPGGGLAVSATADADWHPVKATVESALSHRGWEPEAWYLEVRRCMSAMATVERAEAAARAAGLVGARAEQVRVEVAGLDGHDLVAWRMGLAATARFVATLESCERAGVVEDALVGLGPSAPPLVRSIVVLTWQAPGR